MAHASGNFSHPSDASAWVGLTTTEARLAQRAKGPMTTSDPSLTILVDNQVRAGLVSEHGFAAWLETEELRILFDTGKGPALTANAEALGLGLARADMLVLSHGHYDHTGAVAHMLGLNPSLEVYCHPSALLNRYSNHPGFPPKIVSVPGPDQQALRGLPQNRRHWVEAPLTIRPGLGLTGPIPRVNDWEDTGGPFYLDAESRQPDPIEDDMALWIETDRGLVILLGCCHAGLGNTVEHIRQASGVQKIRALVGGLHLGSASPERLDRTCRAIESWAPEFIAPCHCTGEEATDYLGQHLSCPCRPLRAGDRLVW